MRFFSSFIFLHSVQKSVTIRTNMQRAQSTTVHTFVGKSVLLVKLKDTVIKK